MTDPTAENLHQFPVPMSTTFEIPGYPVKQLLGVAFGMVVYSPGTARGITGGFKAMFRGEVPEFTRTLDEIRAMALGRLAQHVQMMGGNAAIGVRFDSNDVGAINSMEILAYGTAVIV